MQLPMSLPNIAHYVVMNPKLAALGQQLQLSRYVLLLFCQRGVESFQFSFCVSKTVSTSRIVPAAMERAIREIISPVVDRSVTIACMTTRELVTKVLTMG